MKKPLRLSILLIFLLLTHSTKAVISIKFQSFGSPLQRVYVENINRGIFAELASDDVLRLGFKTDIKELREACKGFSVSPNPIYDHTQISFQKKESGLCKFQLTDMEGKVLYIKHQHLDAGLHKMNLNGLQAGVYVLSIQTDKETLSRKIISTNPNKSSVSLNFTQQSSISYSNTYKQKSLGEGVFDLDYDIGEQLKLIAYADGFQNDTLYLSPTFDKTLSFYFNDIEIEDDVKPEFPQPSDAIFYSDYFDFEENKWIDKSGENNHAHIVQSHCGTVKTTTELLFNNQLEGNITDWILSHSGTAEAVLSSEKISFKTSGTIYDLSLSNLALQKEYYYPFSEGILTAFDCSGNANHLTVKASNIEEWTANKQDDFHYNLQYGGGLKITDNLLPNPKFEKGFIDGLAEDWIVHNAGLLSEETELVIYEKSQRFQADSGAGIRTKANLNKLKESSLIRFTAWVYVVSGKAELHLFGYISTSPSVIINKITSKVGEWEKIEVETTLHNCPKYDIFASIFASENNSEIIVGEVNMEVISNEIVVPALKDSSTDALGNELEIQPNSTLYTETSIRFPYADDLIISDRDNFLFDDAQNSNTIKLKDIPFVHRDMTQENTLFCNHDEGKLIIFKEPVGNGYNLKSLLYNWEKPTTYVYKNQPELSDCYLDNIQVQDVNRNFRVGLVNWRSQVVISADYGKTWNEPITLAQSSGIHHVFITSKGSVLIFYEKSKIHRLPYLSTEWEEIHPIDENGDIIEFHTPVNPDFPGEYFKPYHKLLDLYDDVDDSSLIVWGTWANNAGSMGASPIGLFYSTDDCETIKRFYYFGQNPAYTDTGGNAGVGGILLGNPDNPVYCRHVHEVSYNKYNDKIYITCGDSHVRPELHIFETSYDKETDSWEPFVNLVSDEARCQIHRAIGLGFDENGYMYFGSDGDPQIIEQNGDLYNSQGVYKVHMKDVNDLSKYELLHPASDIVVNSYMNDNYMLYSCVDDENTLQVSLNRGKTWTAVDVSAFMTKWYPYDKTPYSCISIIKEDDRGNVFIKTPIGAYVSF